MADDGPGMHLRTRSSTNKSSTIVPSTVIVLAGTASLVLVALLFSQPVMQLQPAYSQQQNNITTQVEIVKGSSNPDNGQFYVPPEIEISSGSTVKWTNDDIAIHTVTQGSPSENNTSIEQPQQQFDSGLMPIGSTFEHTFSEVGLIDYYCTIHPWMTGKVTIS